MGLGNLVYGGLPYEVRKTIRMCCCGSQLHITSQNVQKLAMHPEYQLHNLANTFKADIQDKSIYDIREYFHDSNIPFRYKGCSRSAMSCCGSCTRMCKVRCPQDVMQRAFLFCANVLCAKTEEEKQARYKTSNTAVQLLYDELTCKVPRYFAIAEMVTNMISPFYNKQLEKELLEIYGNEDSPHRLDYAPVIEYETIPGTRPEEGRLRKRVNVETGEVCVLDWPRSGMCPFCLPVGLSERRRAR